MSRTTKTMWFLTTGFYDQYDEYEIKPIRGYHDKRYAEAVCDRLMKWQVDYNNWEVDCENYLHTHPDLRKIPMKDNLYPQTRGKLRAEWVKANPFTTTAKPHDNTYSVTEVPVKVATTAYRVYEQGKYEDTETTLGTFWSSDEAEAFKNEHNRYAEEQDAWNNESFESAYKNPQFVEKRREKIEMGNKLSAMSESDLEYEALEQTDYELFLLVGNMMDNLSNMWKANNPFQTTAAPQNGEAFIETLTIQ